MKKHRHVSVVASIAFVAMTSLVACEGSSSINEETPESSTIPESSAIPESSSSAPESSADDVEDTPYCGESFNLDSADVPFFTCNKSLQTDGIYVGLTNHMTGSCEQTIYYKCMDDEWQIVAKEEIPADSTVHPCCDPNDEDLFLRFKKCNAENEGLFESKCSYYFKGRCAQSEYFRCENGTWVEAEYVPPLPEAECTAENEAALDSVAESHFDSDKQESAEYYYYMCNKNKWNLINGTLAECTTAETKVGDECCDVIYSSSMVIHASHSVLYKYTEDGWARQREYSGLECENN